MEKSDITHRCHHSKVTAALLFCFLLIFLLACSIGYGAHYVTSSFDHLRNADNELRVANSELKVANNELRVATKELKTEMDALKRVRSWHHESLQMYKIKQKHFEGGGGGQHDHQRSLSWVYKHSSAGTVVKNQYPVRILGSNTIPDMVWYDLLQPFLI